MPHAIPTTDEIIAEFKAGRMVVLVDEEDRENERPRGHRSDELP